jgi:hypothetical protein
MTLKWVHDYVQPCIEVLVKHYIEIAGRIKALFVERSLSR